MFTLDRKAAGYAVFPAPMLPPFLLGPNNPSILMSNAFYPRYSLYHKNSSFRFTDLLSAAVHRRWQR